MASATVALNGLDEITRAEDVTIRIASPPSSSLQQNDAPPPLNGRHSPPAASGRLFAKKNRRGIPRQFSLSASATPRALFKGKAEGGVAGAALSEKTQSETNLVNNNNIINNNNNNNMKGAFGFLRKKQPSLDSSRARRHQYSNLFPCPLVKTLDLDSPEGSMASLGLINSHAGAFASSTSYKLAERSRSGRSAPPPMRARSMQSPTRSASRMTLHTPHPVAPTRNRALPARQSSLPAYTVTQCTSASPRGGVSPTPPSRSPLSLSSRGVSPARSPRASGPLGLGSGASPQPPLVQARSISAQTHKLRRQVTIQEDSVSIADSAIMGGLPRQSSLLVRGASVQSSSLPPPLSPELELIAEDAVSCHSAFRFPSGGGAAAGAAGGPSPRVLSPRPPLPAPVLPRQESSFNQEEINSLQEAFAQLDLDGNGKLSRKEVEQCLGKILSDTDLNYLLLDLDTDQNGEVEWQEFLEVMKARMREPESVKMLKEAFRVVAGEYDDSLLISADQMKHSLMSAEGKTSEKEVDEMLHELDLDQDGKVRMEDFVRLLVSDQQPKGRLREGASVEGSGTTSCDSCTIL